MDDDQTRSHDEPATDDPAFARLQAADPASGTAADLTSVYAAVTAATGVDVTEETILVDQLAARRARRAPRWLQVAAVVAGFAVIGGGSYALGGANAGTAPAAGPAMSLGNGEAASPLVGRAPQAAGAGSMAADGKLAGGFGFGFGRTVFASDGLSTAAGSAPAYGFDAVSVYSQETAERVAAALGVTGTAQQQYGQWTVGPNDGTAPSVSISSDGLTSVSYYDPTRDPWSCLKADMSPVLPPAADGTTGSAGSVAGTDAVAPAPEPAPSADTCRTSTDPAPRGDAAVGEAKDTMSALGVDPAGFEFEPSTDSSNAQMTQVTAYQVVDGQRSGLSWSFTIVASGLQSLYGVLAPTVALGDYAVVSPTDAVARLGDPRFGPSYGGIMPLADARAAADGAAVGGATTDIAPAPSDEPTVPATPAVGSPLAWPVQHVTIVSSRLGLALTTLTDGASVLVPTYELSDADGATWTVVAVADTDLDFTP